MLRALGMFVIAYAVEKILWGEAIEVQREITRAAAEGKFIHLKDKHLRLGYPLYFRTHAQITNCTFINEQDWSEKFDAQHSSAAIRINLKGFPDVAEEKSMA